MWSNVSLIGRTLNLTILGNIETILDQERKDGCSIRYLGGLNVLLTFNHKYDAEMFMCGVEKWKQWFSNISVWNGQSLPLERIAWLRIWGIPPQLWDSLVMDKIGIKFGTIVSHSEASTCDSNLTMDSIGVMLSDVKPISEEIIIHWQNKTFCGWVEEDKRNWVPEFVNAGSSPVESPVKENSRPENAWGYERSKEHEESVKDGALHADVVHEETNNNDVIGDRAMNENNDIPTFHFSATRDHPSAQKGIGKNANWDHIGPSFNYGPNSLQAGLGNATRKRRRTEDNWAEVPPDVLFEYPGSLSFSIGAKENRGTSSDPISLDLNIPPTGGTATNRSSDEQNCEEQQLIGELPQMIDTAQHSETNIEVEVEQTINMGNAIGVNLEGHVELV
ncbi:hypothetical protein R6Q59_019196 [Mikania micrantha]